MGANIFKEKHPIKTQSKTNEISSETLDIMKNKFKYELHGKYNCVTMENRCDDGYKKYIKKFYESLDTLQNLHIHENTQELYKIVHNNFYTVNLVEIYIKMLPGQFYIYNSYINDMKIYIIFEIKKTNTIVDLIVPHSVIYINARSEDYNYILLFKYKQYDDLLVYNYYDVFINAQKYNECKICRGCDMKIIDEHCCKCKMNYKNNHCCECKIEYNNHNYYFRRSNKHCCKCKMEYRKSHCCKCEMEYIKAHCCKCKMNYDNKHCCKCKANYDNKHCCKCKTNYDNKHCCKCGIELLKKKHCCDCKINYDDKHCCKCKMELLNDKPENHCCECKINYENNHCCKCKIIYSNKEIHCCKCEIVYKKNIIHCCECKKNISRFEDKCECFVTNKCNICLDSYDISSIYYMVRCNKSIICIKCASQITTCPYCRDKNIKDHLVS
jgi:hypothetical protein